MMKNYDFTDLVLLIGTNPLPNYVVAKYLCDNCSSLQRIWMMHSQNDSHQAGTATIASLLEDVLIRNISGELSFFYIEIKDVGDDRKIQDAVQKVIENISSVSAGQAVVNLNYTGGTKAMAVHVYRGLEKRRLNTSFSYLDARSYSLRFDGNSYPAAQELREKVHICLWDLLELHGEIPKEYFKTNKQERDQVRASENSKHPLRGFLADRFDGMNEEKAIAMFQRYGDMFKSNVEGELERFQDYQVWIKSNNKKYKKSIFENNQNAVCLNVHNDNEVNKDFIDIISFIPDSLVTIDSILNEDFLEGKLFELYVADCVRELIEEKQENGWQARMEIKVGWEIVNDEENANYYEVDVIVINGYQVCVISCTISSNINKAKSKAFEVLHRAQQLGGEEARAILVTQLKDNSVETLEESLRSFTEAQSGKFCIIGPGDFRRDRLKRRIEEMLWERGGRR